MLIGEGSEFYNSSSKRWLKDNDIEINSKYNEGRSVVAEKIYQNFKEQNFQMHDIVNEYNNTYHRAIKIKPVDIKSGNSVKYNVNSNDKGPKFQEGDYVRIPKYKSIFAKGYTPSWSKEVFLTGKVN